MSTSAKPLDLPNILRESVLGICGDGKVGEIRVKPGREPFLESFHTWMQDNVDRLYQLAEVKK